MKKLLLVLLLIAPYAHADTQTTGNMKLLQPTTGQAFDPNDASKRSWGDKFNKNFQIIDSTVTSIFSQLGTAPVISIYDNTNTFIGNATTIRFNSNLTTTQSGSTTTVNGSAGGGSGTVTESTSTLTLFGGGVFLSTFGPIGSATFRVSKSTFYIAGVDAFINKPSSVASTMFKVYYSTSDRYGITWTPITFAVIVDTNLRSNLYTSTGFVINDGWWVGIGIDTVAISGLQAEDWGVNLHGLLRRQGQQW